MLNTSYKKRLTKDLERWSTQGWLSAEGRGAILAELDSQQSPSRLPAIIGILGAVLLATGAMTFVSANWDEMSKLARLILLFSAMWAAFAAAIWFQRGSHTYLLEAMLFLGAGMFGVNIMLIAQIYHIDGHYPDALFLWTVGALAVALALESRASLALAFVLMVIWTGSEVFQFEVSVHWPFLPVWAIGVGLIFRNNWPAGLHLATLSLAFWLSATTLNMASIWDWPIHQVFALLGLIALFIFLTALTREGRSSWLMGFEPALTRYAMLALLAASFFVQTDFHFGGHMELVPASLAAATLLVAAAAAYLAWRREALNGVDLTVIGGFALWLAVITFVPKSLILWLHAPIYIGFSIWLMAYAQRWAYRILLPMALTAFAVEVLYVYAKTMGTLLDTALFFLIGGVLLIVLAVGLEKLRRSLSGPASSHKKEGAS